MDITQLGWHDLPPIITPVTAATLARCTPKTIEERLRRGLLPGDKLGDGWILPTRAFLDELDKSCVEKMHERRKAPEPLCTKLTSIPGGRRAPPPLQ